MSRSNQDAVERWASRTPNPYYHGEIKWSSCNILGDGISILSYGWWPMAYYLGMHDGHRFLKNGDTYSSSTTRHQSYVQRACKGPTVPFSALEAANINPISLRWEHFLEISEDTYIPIYRVINGEPGEWLRGKYWAPSEDDPIFTPPKQGMMVNQRLVGNGDMEAASWHILGGVLIKWNDNHYICGLDNGRYFVSQLADHPNTIEEAYESLKPPQVKEALEKGSTVRRQGEWFFVEMPDLADGDVADLCGFPNVTTMRRALRQHSLPRQRRGNTHDVRYITDLAKYSEDASAGNRIFCKGMVYHRNSWGQSSGEHPSLKLECWHMAYRNTAIESWSTGGRFD